MSDRIKMPRPMQKMFEHRGLDIERCFKSLPDTMQDALVNCRMCSTHHTCDYDVESHYFKCPNRDLLEKLLLLTQ